MQPKFRRTSHDIPGLNLASMPDLIFTVLFFFMLVTHMRDDELKIRYQVPAGTEVQKMQQKSAVINLYVSADGQIQIDNQLTTLAGIASYINKVREGLSPENQDRLTVSLKADKRTPMGVIADVKQELQKSFALKVNYSGTEQ
ncbi:MAG: biopolymer transporter ExbD [Prevotella sp.]|nr:biopolymer transporter ExbD [Prevotella sp.]